MFAARSLCVSICVFFFFNDTATTEIYTLSLHDALPILSRHLACACRAVHGVVRSAARYRSEEHTSELQSHSFISYAVFCLKKNQYLPRSGVPVVAMPLRTGAGGVRGR